MQGNDRPCRTATLRHRYQEIIRVFPREVRLFACIQLRQTSLLRTGESRRGASQSKVRRATRNPVDGPQSGGTVVGIYDRRYRGRNQTVVSGVSVRWCCLSPDLEKAALGRQEFRRQASGWESAAVCWTRKLTATKPDGDRACRVGKLEVDCSATDFGAGLRLCMVGYACLICSNLLIRS